MNNPYTHFIKFWLLLGIVLVTMMVVIGGITRLTHSGLSMVHWSMTGSLPPLNETEWESEFFRYQQSPEFKELNQHFTLSDFKSIYAWEFLHRFFGRFIGLVFLIPFLFFLWRKAIPRSLIPLFFVILSLGLAQAVLGWFMVKSGLVDVPRVSHFRLAAHLLTAFVTCAWILWVFLEFSHQGRKTPAKAPHRQYVLVFLALLLVQLIYGAFTAGLHAGNMHNTWPLMDGEWVADAVLASDSVLFNVLENKSGVQFVHRTLGFIVLMASIVLWRIAHKSAIAKHTTSSKVVVVMVGIQICLGITTLLLNVPLTWAILHQVWALLVLLSTVRALYFASYAIQSSSEAG